MSFTDQKPRTATEEECRFNWRGEKPGETFRCYFCGYKFIPGDIWRFVFAKTYPNFLVCSNCDGPDIQERWAKHVETAKTKFWWFRRRRE